MAQVGSTRVLGERNSYIRSLHSGKSFSFGWTPFHSHGALLELWFDGVSYEWIAKPRFDGHSRINTLVNPWFKMLLNFIILIKTFFIVELKSLKNLWWLNQGMVWYIGVDFSTDPYSKSGLSIYPLHYKKTMAQVGPRRNLLYNRHNINGSKNHH